MNTALYRHFDGKGELLYVGVSLSAVIRLAQHRDHSLWFSAIRRVDVQTFPSREEALRAETHAIKVENPKHNIQKRRRHVPVVEAESPRLTVAKDLIVQTLVLRPMYTIKEAAKVLHIRPIDVQRLIESRQLGSFNSQPNDTTYVSGWQLLSWFESNKAV